MAVNRLSFGISLRLVFSLLFSMVLSFPHSAGAQEEEDYKILREIILHEFRDAKPVQRGGSFSEVISRFPTKEKKVAVALAACLEMGADVDMVLMNKLVENKVPFSVFADQGWLKKNEATLTPLTGHEGVSFESHGTFCRALSSDGKAGEESAKTSGLDEVFEEVEANARSIEKFSGHLPRFYRAGQGSYDDVALKIVNVLGYQAVEGDLKLKAKDVETDFALKAFLKNVKSGSILFIPANRPGTAAEWADKLLDGLKQSGYSVIALDDAIGAEEEPS